MLSELKAMRKAKHKRVAAELVRAKYEYLWKEWGSLCSDLERHLEIVEWHEHAWLNVPGHRHITITFQCHPATVVIGATYRVVGLPMWSTTNVVDALIEAEHAEPA